MFTSDHFRYPTSYTFFTRTKLSKIDLLSLFVNVNSCNINSSALTEFNIADDAILWVCSSNAIPIWWNGRAHIASFRTANIQLERSSKNFSRNSVNSLSRLSKSWCNVSFHREHVRCTPAFRNSIYTSAKILRQLEGTFHSRNSRWKVTLVNHVSQREEKKKKFKKDQRKKGISKKKNNREKNGLEKKRSERKCWEKKNKRKKKD